MSEGHTIAFWARSLKVGKNTVLRRLRALGAKTNRSTLWKKSTPKRVEFMALEADVLAAFPEHAQKIVESAKFAQIDEQLAEMRTAIVNLTKAVAAVAKIQGRERAKSIHVGPRSA